MSTRRDDTVTPRKRVEAALLDALNSGRIAGAALDVFDVEHLPQDHLLRRADNVVLRPHMGYVTAECYEIYFDHIVEDDEGVLQGAPVRQIGEKNDGPGCVGDD